jgi:hypothetical protein
MRHAATATTLNARRAFHLRHELIDHVILAISVLAPSFLAGVLVFKRTRRHALNHPTLSG